MWFPKESQSHLFFHVGIQYLCFILRFCFGYFFLLLFFFWSFSGPGERPPPVQGAGPGLGHGALPATHAAAAELDVLLRQQLVQLLAAEAPAARHSHAVR